MQGEFAIVIPAKNEEASIESVILDVRRHYPTVDVFVINDCSSDNTGEILERLDVVNINHLQTMGAWHATQTGLLKAYESNYDFVVTMDADGQHFASNVKLLLQEVRIDKQCDVVIGACPRRASFLKKAVWKTFKLITGTKIQDITSGFRAYNKAALAILTSEQATLLEYQDLGVILFLKSAGLSIREVPVDMKERFAGKSRIFSSWIKILFYILSTLLLSFSKAHPENKNELFKRLR